MVQMKVILPHGVQPGQVVQVNTVYGPVAIQVPPNAQGGSALLLDVQPPAQAASPPKQQFNNSNNNAATMRSEARASEGARRSEAILPSSRSMPSAPVRQKQNKYSASSSISSKVAHEKGPLEKEGNHTWSCTTAEGLDNSSDWYACLYTACCLCPAFPCVSHLS